jgi:hypothetical protein
MKYVDEEDKWMGMRDDAVGGSERRVAVALLVLEKVSKRKHHHTTKYNSGCSSLVD